MCRQSIAVRIPAQFECDTKNSTGTFPISIFPNGAINERRFNNPTQGLKFHVCQLISSELILSYKAYYFM